MFSSRTLLTGLLFLGLLAGPARAQDTKIIGGGVMTPGGGYSGPIIKQPMMTTLASPSDSATDYFIPVATGEAGAAGSATASNEGAIIGAPGTISNLSCNGSGVTIYAGTWTFTLYHSTGGLNGTFNSTTVACGVTANGTPATSTNNFSVAVGDAITIQSAPPVGQVTTGVFNISFLFTGSGSASGFLWTSGAATTPTVPNFYPVNSFVSNAGNATEVNISNLMPTGGTISNLVFGVKTLPTSGNPITATVNHEAAGSCATPNATSLSAQITSATANTVSDTNPAHAFTVAQNDCVSIQFTSTGAPSVTQWSVAMLWTPTNAGEYPLTESGPTIPAASASATRYLTVQGNIANGGSSTETQQYQYITPVTGGSFGYSTFTAQDLSYLQSTTIGGAGRTAFTLRSALASVSPTLSLTSGLSGANSSNSSTIAANSLIDVLTTMGGTTGNTATWSKTSMGVVVQ